MDTEACEGSKVHGHVSEAVERGPRRAPSSARILKLGYWALVTSSIRECEYFEMSQNNFDSDQYLVRTREEDNLITGTLLPKSKWHNCLRSIGLGNSLGPT